MLRRVHELEAALRTALRWNGDGDEKARVRALLKEASPAEPDRSAYQERKLREVLRRRAKGANRG